jgi:hypothetical protein
MLDWVHTAVGRLTLLLFFCSGLLGASNVSASEVEIDFLTITQGYQSRTLSGDLLDRRRITQWASLRAMRLLDVDGLGLSVSFRFDTDLGLPEGDYGVGPRIEMLAASFAAKNLLDAFDLTLGRQLLIDSIDFCEFDGLRLDLRLVSSFDLGVGLRLLSGLQVRDRSWLGGDYLELDGVEMGEVPAPLLGVGLWASWQGLFASVDYRRVVLWQDGWPLDSERLGAAGAARLLGRRLGLDASAVFDLAQDRFQRIQADLWGRLPWPVKGLRIEVGTLRSRPHFALDSIFHFFSPAPFWQVQAGLGWHAPRGPGLGGSLRASFFHRGYEEGQPGTDDGVDGLQVDGRLRWSAAGFVWLSAGYEQGVRGERWLLAPGVDFQLLPSALSLQGRLLLMSNRDSSNPGFDTLVGGGSAGVRWVFGPQRSVLLVADLNGSRINPLRFRLLAVVDLAFTFGRAGAP